MFSFKSSYVFLKKKKNTPKKEKEIIRIFILKTSNVRTKYTCTIEKKKSIGMKWHFQGLINYDYLYVDILHYNVFLH